MPQDVFDFVRVPLLVALDSVFVSGVFAVSLDFGFSAAAALTVRSLKDMSSIL